MSYFYKGEGPANHGTTCCLGSFEGTDAVHQRIMLHFNSIKSSILVEVNRNTVDLYASRSKGEAVNAPRARGILIGYTRVQRKMDCDHAELLAMNATLVVHAIILADAPISSAEIDGCDFKKFSPPWLVEAKGVHDAER